MKCPILRVFLLNNTNINNSTKLDTLFSAKFDKTQAHRKTFGSHFEKFLINLENCLIKILINY